MKIRADIIHANRDNWGVYASINVLHVPFPGNVLFVCLLIFKFNSFCDSSVVIISVCIFFFYFNVCGVLLPQKVKGLSMDSGRAEGHVATSGRLPDQGWGRAGSYPQAVFALPGQKAFSWSLLMWNLTLSVNRTLTSCSRYCFIF